ncbi:guanylyl cyclase [Phyllobacterium sp. BT25]|uniref:Guanylyl cyclase n=2 Tax=Phyllobacterium pellucidum TaxID=2740464 RepID=A0A849VSJ2_9HYPH|nr:rhodanese-like domain-containing protein [Phyllobacterium pellucidum]NTS32978.1 guanylyl cyclase [Phyllobacterium pellucidum]
MGMDHAERRLVAILAVDIVGYSRLVEADEAGTLAAIRDLRSKVTDPLLAEYRGRIVKLMGDGAIMEFGSVVDAVVCAVALQRGTATHQAGVAADRRLVFRMGINLGDVVVEGDDLLGDGVNVAARLEQLCEPGGLFVSGTAYDQLPGRLELPVEFVGERHMKNIARPVRTYRVRLRGTDIAKATIAGRLHRWAIVAAVVLVAVSLAGSTLWLWPRQPVAESAMMARMKYPLPKEPSIAVMPLDDLSPGPSQAYFADGITEDLITELSELPGLFVIARHSSFTYKGRPTKLQDIAEAMGVRYVLEGNLRRDGDFVRIEAQLTDALNNQRVWDKHYEGRISQVSALQNKLVGEIGLSLQVNVPPSAESAQAETTPEAYDRLLEGLGHLRIGTDVELLKSITLFNESLNLDPYYSRAHAAVAAANWEIAVACWNSGNSAFRKAMSSVDQSLPMAMLYQNALAYAISSEVLAAHGGYDQALIAINRAIQLDANDPEHHIRKARYLNAAGRAPEAEVEARLAMRLDPKYPPEYLRALAISLFHQEKYEDAVDALKYLITLQWDVADDYATLTSGLGHLGNLGGVQLNMAKYNGITIPFGRGPLTVQAIAWQWYVDMSDYYPAYRDRLLEGLRKAGVPEGAGTDIAYETYAKAVNRVNGEYSVSGAPKLGAAAVKRLIDEGAQLIDVRSPRPFSHAHIPGSINLPATNVLSKATLSEKVGASNAIIFTCQAKYCVDAAFASAKALAWGYPRVSYFADGIAAWQDANYPTETSLTK